MSAFLNICFCHCLQTLLIYSRDKILKLMFWFPHNSLVKHLLMWRSIIFWGMLYKRTICSTVCSKAPTQVVKSVLFNSSGVATSNLTSRQTKASWLGFSGVGNAEWICSLSLEVVSALAAAPSLLITHQLITHHIYYETQNCPTWI